MRTPKKRTIDPLTTNRTAMKPTSHWGSTPASTRGTIAPKRDDCQAGAQPGDQGAFVGQARSFGRPGGALQSKFLCVRGRGRIFAWKPSQKWKSLYSTPPFPNGIQKSLKV